MRARDDWELEGGRLTVRGTVVEEAVEDDESDGEDGLEPRYPRLAAKLLRMRTRLSRQGFTSFIE